MNLTTDYICDDWGWYVDTDDILFSNTNVNMVYNPYKKMYYNILDKIEEDEYDYYKNNNRDIENLELEYLYKKNKTKNKTKNSRQINLYKIGSTTLITALLTYAIFFLI